MVSVNTMLKGIYSHKACRLKLYDITHPFELPLKAFSYIMLVLKEFVRFNENEAKFLRKFLNGTNRLGG